MCCNSSHCTWRIACKSRLSTQRRPMKGFIAKLSYEPLHWAHRHRASTANTCCTFLLGSLFLIALLRACVLLCAPRQVSCSFHTGPAQWEPSSSPCAPERRSASRTRPVRFLHAGNSGSNACSCCLEDDRLPFVILIRTRLLCQVSISSAGATTNNSCLTYSSSYTGSIFS